MNNRIDTLIIGAGQAGLALSRGLTDRRVEHVVLERATIGARWSARWDSLRLLTPNWMTRLPGWQYRGPQRDGFMARDEVVAFLRSYARSFDAPVREATTVLRVARDQSDWMVVTDRGTWRASRVVIATGHCQKTAVPAIAQALSPRVMHLTVAEYRNAASLPDAGVLIVGASSSGIQLADEIERTGRPVVLAVGRHTRLPRRYRGRDILHWLDRMGTLARPRSDMARPHDTLHEPSLQLVGSDPPTTLDLTTLATRRIRLAGRLTRLDGARAEFADDLGRTVAEADARLSRLLARIDRHIASHGTDRLFARETVERSTVPIDDAPRTLDLAATGIQTVIWATGCARSYRWLHAPVFDDRGDILHVRGRTSERGLYVLGLQFMIRRNSSLLDGVGRDALELADDIAWRARQRQSEAA